MIIDKNPMAPEDAAFLDEYTMKLDAWKQALERAKDDGEKSNIFKIATEEMFKNREIRRRYRESYRDRFKNNPAAILEVDAAEILAAVDRKEDFYPYIEGTKEAATAYYKKCKMAADTLPEELEELALYIKEHCYRNYMGFYNFLYTCLNLQIWAYLQLRPGDYDPIIEAVKRRATSREDGYKEKKEGVIYVDGWCCQDPRAAATRRKALAPSFWTDEDPMGFAVVYQGAGVNGLALLNSSKERGRKDPTGLRVKETRDGQMELKLPNNNRMRPSCVKLLWSALAELHRLNHYGSADNLTVSIPLDEYMKKNGAKQTENSMKNWRKKIDADLDTLFNASVSWKEANPKRGMKADYKDVRIIIGKGISKGQIMLVFSPPMGQYLISAYPSRFPLGALLQIDEQYYPLAVPLLIKMATHNTIDKNVKAGTNNVLTVKTLIEACGDNLASYEELMQSNDRHPDKRIVERIVKTLNYMQDQGWIKWHYCNAGGRELEPEQLDQIDDDGFCPYSLFISLRVYFEITGADQSDQLDRRQRNEEKKARRQELQEKAEAAAKARQKVKQSNKK